MKKKSMIIAIAIFVVMAAVFGVTLGLMLANKESVGQGAIIIKVGNSENEYLYSELVEKVGGEKDFMAIYKPSGKTPIEKKYTGIELKTVLGALDIDYKGAVGVRFTATDGFQNIYPTADILKDNNVFIARLVEGKPFEKGIAKKGTDLKNEDGGEFVVIRTADTVSQNRVRCMVKLEVYFE